MTKGSEKLNPLPFGEQDRIDREQAKVRAKIVDHGMAKVKRSDERMGPSRHSETFTFFIDFGQGNIRRRASRRRSTRGRRSRRRRGRSRYPEVKVRPEIVDDRFVNLEHAIVDAGILVRELRDVAWKSVKKSIKREPSSSQLSQENGRATRQNG